MESNYDVFLYTEKEKDIWDDFVEKISLNGTFLQTRRFLNYHPKDRFEDHSMIIKDKKGHIAAVCPACIVTENGERKLISHMGSTFGGLVIAPKHYYAHKVIEMIRQMESYLKQEGGERLHISNCVLHRIYFPRKAVRFWNIAYFIAVINALMS